MDAADDLPEVIERLERARVAEDDQVEPAVVLAGDGDEGKPQGVAGQVEDEDGRAAQDLLGAGVDDPDGDRREAVGEAGAEDRLDVGHPVGRPDASRAGDPPAMVAGDDVGVEAEAGHEEESAAGGLADVDAARTGRRRSSGPVRAGRACRPKWRATRFSVPAGMTVSGRARSFIEQRRDRAVAADGDEAAAIAVARPPVRTRAERASGRPGDLGAQSPSRRSSMTSCSTSRRPRPAPEPRLATIPTQGVPVPTPHRLRRRGVGPCPISCAGSFPAA